MGLDTVELILLIEKRLDISFEDAEIEKISTVGEISTYAFQLQNPDSQKSLNEVQAVVIDCIHTVTGIDKVEITLGSCVVKDLGLD